MSFHFDCFQSLIVVSRIKLLAEHRLDLPVSPLRRQESDSLPQERHLVLGVLMQLDVTFAADDRLENRQGNLHAHASIEESDRLSLPNSFDNVFIAVSLIFLFFLTDLHVFHLFQLLFTLFHCFQAFLFVFH